MTSSKIVVYSQKITHRMLYIFHTILKDLLGLEPVFVHKGEELPKDEAVLCYGCYSDEHPFFIAADELLFERGIREVDLNFSTYDNLPCFFTTFHKNSQYPFDLFAASFYLISRYEEYLPYLKDKYGRFNAPQSLAFQKGFLDKPIINIWALDLAKKLQEAFPKLKLQLPEFRFQPTIDIDAAYAYKQKGFWRSLGGYFKNFRAGDWLEIRKRTDVLLGKRKDPFDSFDYIFQFHKQLDLKPIFFVLFADYGTNDKNTPVHNRHFQTLVRRLGDYGQVGIHPSFTSNTVKGKLHTEISRLSAITHSDITCSRQHFLMLSFPETYNRLMEEGIEADYTMGYASQPGFRASIASPFYFYNLEYEMLTSLKVFPFVYMEGTYRDYLNLSIEESYESIKQLTQEVKNVGGLMISLWHNESLGGEKRWKGWTELYEKAVAVALD